MMPGEIRKLAQLKNLRLAVDRLGTASNPHYKRFYRASLNHYRIALEENLHELGQRVSKGSYSPQEPHRIFVPKPSGLQRPITILSLEDNIVYQALANRFVERLQDKRLAIEGKFVFSNLLNRKGDPAFMFLDWRSGYNSMRRRMTKLYEGGFVWVAYFDLAAFYDTISHELLVRRLFPRGQDRFCTKAVDWLRVWSSDQKRSTHNHGIPQGPIASNFLAECFLLPIDMQLSQRYKYVRYVDDFRFFGQNEREVREATIAFDQLCSDQGIVPQTKKFKIVRLESTEELLEDTPSLTGTTRQHSRRKSIAADEAVQVLLESMDPDTLKIIKKSKARYALYRSEPNKELTKAVVSLLPTHPEHIDALLYYLRKYPITDGIRRKCMILAVDTPYDFVRGELLMFLADTATRPLAKEFVDKVVLWSRNRRGHFMQRFGSCRLLCTQENLTGMKYANFLEFQPALIQSLMIPFLPNRLFGQASFIRRLLKRTSPEPSLALSIPFIERNLSHLYFGVHASQLSRQARNVYRRLGIIRERGTSLDPVGEQLRKRFKIVSWEGWNAVFAGEYTHACRLLVLADESFKHSPSSWLMAMDSFNDILFRRLLIQLRACGHKFTQDTHKTNGDIHPLGNLLGAEMPFSRAYPEIVLYLREVHERRTTLPEAHPYTTKRGLRTQPLDFSERNMFVGKLQRGYNLIIKEAPRWGLQEIGGTYEWILLPQEQSKVLDAG